MADKDPSDNKTGASNEEKDELGDDLAESLGSQSSGLTSSSDSYSMPKRQRETSPSRSPVRSESPSAPYRMVPRKCETNFFHIECVPVLHCQLWSHEITDIYSNIH